MWCHGRKPVGIHFAEHDRRSPHSLSTITSRWRRSYFYIVAVYHDNSQGEDSPNYEQRLARLEYVSLDNYNIAYVRYTGKWIDIDLGLTLQQCLTEIAQNELFHPR